MRRLSAHALAPCALLRRGFAGMVHDMALRAALDAMSRAPSLLPPGAAPLRPDVEVDAQTWKSLVVR